MFAYDRKCNKRKKFFFYIYSGNIVSAEAAISLRSQSHLHKTLWHPGYYVWNLPKHNCFVDKHWNTCLPLGRISTTKLVLLMFQAWCFANTESF